MCLTIDLNKHRPPLRLPRPAIATSPIKCYKIVSWKTGRDPQSKKKKTFKSHFQGFLYELNKTYEADISHRISQASYKIDVHEGIHSFTSLAILDKIKSYNFRGNSSAVLECEIPSGAKYYYGQSGDIVSNKLKTLRAYDLEKFKLVK